ncbi:MAG TPA: hypothetical protein PLW86_12645 [Rhodocyclaceae bacterium]|nr:hypothetical protein [Rhodocyclaceae bacterium]
MLCPEIHLKPRLIFWAFALSVLIHGLALWADRQKTSLTNAAAPARIEARLTPPSSADSRPAPAVSLPAPATPARIIATPSPRSRQTSPPRWSAAEKAEMKQFLDELAEEARRRPPPTLAQRALAMARNNAREQARLEGEQRATLEMRPAAQPPDPFSLGMYVDGLIRRLNHSAAFVSSDPRSRGVRPATVQFRLNPDGTLKSFVVLNAGDQASEIAFIQAVVERSTPFAPFPPDVNRAARSLAMTICILPTRSGDSFGFSRMEGQRC